jgi:BirA family biotin operon repressor/biotin-[acetyl-CoA-carboxylase] ligase
MHHGDQAQESVSDHISDDPICSSPAPLPFARTVVHCPIVDSTNDLAKNLLLRGLDELPLVVWADQQRLGRGRSGNQWWSDEGSLTFTIALDPLACSLRIDQEPRLALLTAVATIQAIDTLGLRPPGIGIRWPNDIEVQDRKLGGILPERVETNGGHRVIIGVGLNVLTRMDKAPEAVRQMATSLSAIQVQPLDPMIIPRFLATILTHFEHELYRLAGDDPELAREWNQLNLLRDQPVRVILGPRVIEGRVAKIDPQGALCIHDGQQLHHLFGGQVLRDHPAGDH